MNNDKNPYSPTNRPPYPWVKVEDELPEPFPETVLSIFTSKYGSRFGVMAYYYEKDWYFESDDIKVSDAGCKTTHWQYMPALPE